MNANKLTRNLVFILLIILSLSLVYSQSEYPAIPAFFYGKATFNGRDIALNSKIIAKVNGEKAGEILVDIAGEYGREKGDYKLLVKGSQSTVADTIEFYLKMPGFAEIKADQTDTWMSGEITNLDLTFTGEAGEEPELTTNGGGDGGSNVVQSNEATFFYTLIEKGKQKDISINNDNILLTKVQLILNSDFDNITIKFENVASGPEALENVYKYVSAEIPVPDKNVAIAILKFKIPNTWFTNYDPEKVVLMRYNNGWEPLETTYEGNDANYHYYRAGTPGFSYFAAVSEKLDEAEVQEFETEETEAIPEDTVPDTEEVKVEEDTQDNEITGFTVLGGENGSKLVTVLLAVALLIILSYLFYDKVIRGG